MTDNQSPQSPENTNTGAAQAFGTQAPPPPGGTVPPPPTYQQAPPQQQAYTYDQAQNGKTRSQGFGSVRKEKWPAVVLAFVLGPLGIHKFYLGYKTEGLAMLLISIIGSLCAGLGPLVMCIFALIEAAKYVSLTEEDFQSTYVIGYKGWF